MNPSPSPVSVGPASDAVLLSFAQAQILCPRAATFAQKWHPRQVEYRILPEVENLKPETPNPKPQTSNPKPYLCPQLRTFKRKRPFEACGDRRDGRADRGVQGLWERRYREALS